MIKIAGFLLPLLMLQGIQVPQPVGYVNDFANVISPANAERIQGIIEDVKAKSGGEIVVVTMAKLNGRDIADVAREIGRQWKVGAKGEIGTPGRNAGLIILVVPKESSDDGRGHVRIETGTGTEGFITDATSGDFVREATPAFRAGDYGAGIALITERVAERYANEFHFTLDSAANPPPGPRQSVVPPADDRFQVPPILWLVLFFVIISLLGGGRRSGRGGGCSPIWFLPLGGGGWGGGGYRGGGGWGGGGGGFGGGGGGGFGGFGGGGGFSGGGSSGSW